MTGSREDQSLSHVEEDMPPLLEDISEEKEAACDMAFIWSVAATTATNAATAYAWQAVDDLVVSAIFYTTGIPLVVLPVRWLITGATQAACYYASNWIFSACGLADSPTLQTTLQSGFLGTTWTPSATWSGYLPNPNRWDGTLLACASIVTSTYLVYTATDSRDRDDFCERLRDPNFLMAALTNAVFYLPGPLNLPESPAGDRNAFWAGLFVGSAACLGKIALHFCCRPNDVDMDADYQSLPSDDATEPKNNEVKNEEANQTSSQECVPAESPVYIDPPTTVTDKTTDKIEPIKEGTLRKRQILPSEDNITKKSFALSKITDQYSSQSARLYKSPETETNDEKTYSSTKLKVA